MKLSNKIQLSSIFILFFLIFALPANAVLINDLKNKISDKTIKIKEINTEIANYQKEIDSLGYKSNTLKDSIYRLDLTRKKLEAGIEFTQMKINSSVLSISKLSLDITTKSFEINNSNKAIGEMIRKMDDAESDTLLEVILSNDTFSSFFDSIENLRQIQSVVSKNLKKLELLKVELITVKSQKEKQKKLLVNSQSELGDKKKIIENNKSRKYYLLRNTNNKESNYKKLVEEKRTQKEKFERELLDYESQLRITIDPNSIPKPGIRIFSSPLPKMSTKSCYNGGTGNCVTQFFGNTKFAKTGAYEGKGHNGVDFRASIGTKVSTVLSGTVTETGNTDAYKGCYSYGRWVLVKHNDGLSTLYAHLNLIKVKPGQVLSTGDMIGYSGHSGYTTGPHLHLTTFITKGVKIVRLGDIKKITHCKDARIPVAPFNSYLNSLDYL